MNLKNVYIELVSEIQLVLHLKKHAQSYNLFRSIIFTGFIQPMLLLSGKTACLIVCPH